MKKTVHSIFQPLPVAGNHAAIILSRCLTDAAARQFTTRFFREVDGYRVNDQFVPVELVTIGQIVEWEDQEKNRLVAFFFLTYESVQGYSIKYTANKNSGGHEPLLSFDFLTTKK